MPMKKTSSTHALSSSSARSQEEFQVFCTIQMSTAISPWKHQFSSDHWSKARLRPVSTWMGDRLGIQVAVDILHFSAFLIQAGSKWWIFFCSSLNRKCKNHKRTASKKSAQPGLEHSNLGEGIAGERSFTCYTAEPPITRAAVQHFWLISWGFVPSSCVYGHITLNTPVLVRSLKLSKVETC